MMEIIFALSIVAIIIAALVWYKAKVFIAEHVDEYNKHRHFIDLKHLKELKTHDEQHISEKAKSHHRNVKISAIVIITSLLILIAQRVY